MYQIEIWEYCKDPYSRLYSWYYLVISRLQIEAGAGKIKKINIFLLKRCFQICTRFIFNVTWCSCDCVLIGLNYYLVTCIYLIFIVWNYVNKDVQLHIVNIFFLFCTYICMLLFDYSKTSLKGPVAGNWKMVLIWRWPL